MDQGNPLWPSAWASYRHEPATSEGLTARQEDSELFQQEDHELYHSHDDVAESHDYGHKRRRLDAGDYGIDHTSVTWDTNSNVAAESGDVYMVEDDATHRETDELVILPPVHLSSQPSNDVPNCALVGRNSNLPPNTGVIVSTDGIKISDVCLLNPPPKNNPKYNIVIKRGIKDDGTSESADRKGNCNNNCVLWKDPFVFAGDITDKTLLTFTVRNKRFPKDITIGAWECRAINLFEMQSNIGWCKLEVSGDCQLIFNIEKISGLDVVSGVVEQASVELGCLPNLEAPAQTVNFIDSVARVYNDNEKTWISFLDTFQVFMKVMDNVSEINIYAQTVWSILSVIPKTILSKRNRDDKVKQLCEKLKDIYEYITDAERFRGLTTAQSNQYTNRSIARWSTMLSTLVQQTLECAHFIRVYGTETTARNIIKAIGGSVDAKIQAFNDKVDHLMKVITESVSLEVGITTLRVSGAITELNELTLLGEIPYDSRAGYFPDKECLPGTRQRLIKEIFEWANNDSSTQVLVLSGQAGIGKSAIAHTIARMLKEQNRLGSMFCFSQGYVGQRNRLFSTISRNLADGDVMWRKELLNVIRNDSEVRKKEDVRTQFNELIIKPSQKMPNIGPVVIVVDALDESGNREERREILKILLEEWAKLPKRYRMLVTTRPEQDIDDQCQKSKIPCKRMGDIDAEETHHDIEIYVSERLNPLSSILDSIDKDWCSILARRAQGLFQWAQSACGFIDNGVKIPDLIRGNWKTCVSNSSLSLYALYHQIISSQPESQYDVFQERFKAIVGAIITAQEPLSLHALQYIFGEDIKDIRSILSPFGSFFSGIHDSLESAPVRPLHTSLFDFFVAKKISEKNQQIAEKINEYYIDTSNQSQMTLGCLKVMNRMLCFNICQLETSHLQNREVADFNVLVEKAIPLHLSYSCRFWDTHLQSSAHSEELVRAIRTLMDDKLLYYFEALSLLKAVDRGCAAMQKIADWCEDTNGDLSADATDARRFGTDFGGIMMESTPHLYISALPFTPCDSFVSKRYLERYPGLFTFDIGQPVGSSRIIGITQTIPDVMIAFSPKDTYIATASNNIGREFSIWNYITGEHLAHWEPERECFLGIQDIVYSLDGELVYCCLDNGNILVWIMETKEMRIERYGGIVGGNGCCCRTISSDGRFVICQPKYEADRNENAVLVIDRRRHRIVKRFRGEYYFSAISPNGNWISLYVRDKEEMCIWDTRSQTQHCVIPCYFWAEVALSDSYIAFEADETTIVIWDLRPEANTELTEISHEKPTDCLCLSPDDQYILVASAGMHSIWSVTTGELISRSYEYPYISCLGFSHDSKSIALYTCGDETLLIQQWHKSIEPNHPPGDEIQYVRKIWLRGSYLILWYETNLENYLRISDIATMNSVIFEAELEGEFGPVSVSSDEENVRVAYGNSRGLCLWNDKEGEIVVDGSVRSTTALVCLDHYLISAHERIINIRDICTQKIIHGPTECSSEVKSLLPLRGTTRFAAIYGDTKLEADIRDCESGDRVGSFQSKSYIDVSVNEKHVICMSENGVDILDLTGARVGLISFSDRVFIRRLSPNGRYMTWFDNGEIKIFDVDTEGLLTVPPLGRRLVQDIGHSDDSKCIILKSGDDWQGHEYLDIWDIQSKSMVTKPIRYPYLMGTLDSLVLSKRHLGVLDREIGKCHVSDLDTYEIMSTLYNAPPLLGTDGFDIEGTPICNKVTLDYALMAWKKASLHAFGTMNEKGWVLGLQGELLFWVPPKMRQGFWFSCMTHMPIQNVTKLNFTSFVHGSDWIKCELGNS